MIHVSSYGHKVKEFKHSVDYGALFPPRQIWCRRWFVVAPYPGNRVWYGGVQTGREHPRRHKPK